MKNKVIIIINSILLTAIVIIIALYNLRIKNIETVKWIQDGLKISKENTVLYIGDPYDYDETVNGTITRNNRC